MFDAVTGSQYLKRRLYDSMILFDYESKGLGDEVYMRCLYRTKVKETLMYISCIKEDNNQSITSVVTESFQNHLDQLDLKPAPFSRYTPEELRQPLPPLPELPDEDNASPDIPKEDWKEPKDAEARNVVVGRHQHLLQKEGSSWRRVSREAPGDFAVIDAYGEHGWVEGPELADYCG